ncbi:MAG: carboxypeptidase regulatory-like domain-containing protein, partial [Culturomica sp.]|nr:carboxypeptidase regulatory-like domain-containing protein [Culturomica sp.]
MRKSILNYITIIVALILLADCSSKDTEIAEPSSIYGVVSDKATGEPVSSAGVSLSPTGAKTVTGSEGQYEFAELEAGAYKINVTKAGYKDLINWAINVREGKTHKGDVQIERIPAVLRVANSNGVDIDTLDLGSSAGVTTANFNIFNDGVVVLEWSIVENSDWITDVSATEGTLESGKTQGIIITIDRSKLLSGVNVTKLNINSNAGSKEITVRVMDTRPLVSVENATNISTTTATLNGTILFAGTPMYTERGFVYDTLPEPTLATTQKKVSLTSTAGDSYSAGITDLHQGTKYYVRAYAVNVSGTSYSTNEVDFTTQVLLPTLTTQAATDKNVAAGTATFNGTILTVGDPAYTERGFVYGLNLNPTTNNTKKTVAGTGVGTFNAGIDSLTEGNVYHIRSYAINMAGTAYGNDTTLNFVITMPTVSTQNITNQSIATGTATFNGTLVSVGDLPITERGFVYATTANPTLDNSKVIATGTGTGAFNANVTGLTEGSTYHVRAYATNSKGTVYGEGISFAFIATLPKVSTQAVTNRDIVAGTATFNGTLITVGDPACTERGFVYSTTANPTLDDSKVIATGTGTGAFNANVTGLTEGSTYHVRAYATNSNSTVYGEEVSVDFNAVMPTVSTQAVTNKDIVAGTATFNGTILTAGNLEITERGF